MSEHIKRISASVVDGRALSVYYAQAQLKKLHDALLSSKSEITSALKSDSGNTLAEIEAEYSLALGCLREQYSALDADQQLEDEYSLTNKKDQISRVTAVGCVYVVPCRYSPFYSAVAPVGVAIGTGNCVVVELKQTISELNSLLRQLLSAALSADTFAVVDSKPNDPQFFSRCTLVQEEVDQQSSRSNQVISSASSRVVAIVDRTSDIKEAAREIIRARLSFQGRSPYAPDLVLVNEFALKDFCNAATQLATSYFAEQVDVVANGSASKAPKRTEGGVSPKELSEGDAETLVSASRGSIVLARKRNSRLLSRKVSEPMLLVHPVSSLDDAIDLANPQTSEPLLAIYTFGTPAAVKYLSQFVDARLTCANKIPVDLLVGPACPTSYPSSIDAHSRFTKSMFTRPHPEFINFSARSGLFSQLLDLGYGSKAWNEILQQSQMTLSEKKRAAEHQNVGFFEQGLLAGSSVLLTGIVASAAVVGYWVVPAALRRFR